ncbi:MAG: hypothetical protein NXH97_02895 [Rhodobacteraceae bacterium]|nr:hypothetical protein [Paracoccaceae bacterium]
MRRRPILALTLGAQGTALFLGGTLTVRRTAPQVQVWDETGA